MDEWWREPDTEICLFHVPVGGGASHVLTLHARVVDLDAWEYAIVQWWHKSPTLWLRWVGGEVVESSPELLAQTNRSLSI